MSRIKRVLFPFVILLALAVGSLPAAAAAAGPATFTVTAKSAYLRNAPSADAPITGSVFKNQVYTIIGRTADGTWLRLDFVGATQGTWIWAALGTVAGDLNSVPVITIVPSTPPTPAATAVSNFPTGQPPGQVTFTLALKSVYARNIPSLTGLRVGSIFKGQTFNVRARTAAGDWLQIDITGMGAAWVFAAYGTVMGNLNSLPITAGVVDPVVTATPTPVRDTSWPVGPTQPAVPVVSANARAIYQRGLTLGNNPRAFSKVGDCQNVVPFFLAAFDNSNDYRLGTEYAYLQPAVDYFKGSFSRKSEAVRGGFNVASVLNPMWTNPKNCKSGETPIECEFRIHRPSIVIINMETWWSGSPTRGYEDQLRLIVEFSIDRGVVPVLGTKADNLEQDGSINAAIVRVAQEYDVPLWNFWAATQPLPNHGLTEDGFHITWGRAFFDDPAAMRRAWPWRNLTALQSLEAVWKAVK